MRNQRVIALSLVLTGGLAALLGPAPTPPPTSHPTPTGWQVITDPRAALTYQVPPDWTLAEHSESLESSSGVELGHLADFGPYLCQGAEYGRAFSGSGITRGEPGDKAAELAAAVAADQYSDGVRTARVRLAAPAPIDRDGVHGTLVRATAKVADGVDRCASTEGTVIVVALATKSGTSVVVLAADTTPVARMVSPTVVQTIADSVRPSG